MNIYLQFLYAIYRGDVDVVKWFLEQGTLTDLYLNTEFSEFYLWFADEKDPNGKDIRAQFERFKVENDDSMFTFALKRGNAEIIKLFYLRGGITTSIGDLFNHVDNDLILNISPSCLRQVAMHDAEFSAAPLFSAVIRGIYDEVKRELANNSGVINQVIKGTTVLHWAIMLKDDPMLQLLINQKDINASAILTEFKYTPLMVAVRTRNVKSVQCLLDKFTPNQLAINHQSINEETGEEDTALELAISKRLWKITVALLRWNTHHSRTEAIIADDPSTAHACIDFKKTDEEDENLFIRIIKNRNITMISLLLADYIDKNPKHHGINTRDLDMKVNSDIAVLIAQLIELKLYYALSKWLQVNEETLYGQQTPVISNERILATREKLLSADNFTNITEQQLKEYEALIATIIHRRGVTLYETPAQQQENKGFINNGVTEVKTSSEDDKNTVNENDVPQLIQEIIHADKQAVITKWNQLSDYEKGQQLLYTSKNGHNVLSLTFKHFSGEDIIELLSLFWNHTNKITRYQHTDNEGNLHFLSKAIVDNEKEAVRWVIENTDFDLHIGFSTSALLEFMVKNYDDSQADDRLLLLACKYNIIDGGDSIIYVNRPGQLFTLEVSGRYALINLWHEVINLVITNSLSANDINKKMLQLMRLTELHFMAIINYDILDWQRSEDLTIHESAILSEIEKILDHCRYCFSLYDNPALIESMKYIDKLFQQLKSRLCFIWGELLLPLMPDVFQAKKQNVGIPASKMEAMEDEQEDLRYYAKILLQEQFEPFPASSTGSVVSSSSFPSDTRNQLTFAVALKHMQTKQEPISRSSTPASSSSTVSTPRKRIAANPDPVSPNTPRSVAVTPRTGATVSLYDGVIRNKNLWHIILGFLITDHRRLSGSRLCWPRTQGKAVTTSSSEEMSPDPMSVQRQQPIDLRNPLAGLHLVNPDTVRRLTSERMSLTPPTLQRQQSTGLSEPLQQLHMSDPTAADDNSGDDNGSDMSTDDSDRIDEDATLGDDERRALESELGLREV